MEGAIRALGEVALRVNDLDRMQEFYENVVGLDVLRRFPSIVFFRIGEGYAGHTTVFALFDRDVDVGQSGTTLDHVAFAIDAADYEAEKRRLEDAGLDVRTAVHDWVGWRALFVRDPEGNLVELVCRDPTLAPTWQPPAPPA